MLHKYEIWESNSMGCTSMMAADIPHEQKCLEDDAVKLTQFEFNEWKPI